MSTLLLMGKWVVRAARESDRRAVSEMQVLLWPITYVEENEKEIAEILSSGACGTLPAAILVATAEDDAAIGFVQWGCGRTRTVAIRGILWDTSKGGLCSRRCAGAGLARR